ncbi:MAG: iron-containing alcohol dehydrogenase [Clostridia bacterium]|nr:iron-containing alcohol dehydrogenase [Clostridia bacterium]
MKPVNLYYRAYQKVMYVAVYALPWNFPEIVKGAGSVKKIPKILQKKGINNVMIVTDKGLTGLGLLNGLYASLEDAGIAYSVFDGVQPNPTTYNVEEARELYIENGCQGVIAFGGGSPMDCAKIMAARLVKPHQSVQQMAGLLKIRKKLPTFIAVPTTAGTGSETTLAAVISDPDTHTKFPINDTSLLPDYAVLDPELTIGLPPHITSTTGMDALTHAVEAYIGKSNTKDTAEKALEATKLIFRYLEKAYANGKDLMAREKMLVASHYAGIAFTRAYVGYVHAIAHALGGLYGIPHGLANAVILPHVLDYYGETAYDRLADLADAADLTPEDKSARGKALAFVAAIRQMNADMNIPTGFTQIKEEDIDFIVERALHEGNPLYPVPKIMDKKDCEAVVRGLILKD